MRPAQIVFALWPVPTATVSRPSTHTTCHEPMLLSCDWTAGGRGRRLHGDVYEYRCHAVRTDPEGEQRRRYACRKEKNVRYWGKWMRSPPKRRSTMRSVLMALVVVWWCPLTLLPVLLGQQSQENWDRSRDQGDMDKYDIFYPTLRSGSVQQQPRRRTRHARSATTTKEEEVDNFVEDDGEVVYLISAPVLFEDGLHLHLLPASDFISPGFVIQRVSGNYTWLERVGQEPKLDCFFSGYVLGQEDSVVSLAVCDGMRGILHLKGRRYFIEPLKNSSTSLPLHQRPHIIYQPTTKNNTASRCSSTENYKHHRLKPGSSDGGVNATSFTDFIQNSIHPHRRQKRSPGVSRKHVVETLVVADSAMFQYHGSDVQQYVLTLMSIVANIYRDPSINNYINIVVVKFVIFQSEQDMPFNVSFNAATSLREFCLWQHGFNNFDPNSFEHHDTAILITREDICRAPGKCDTLGLAELGTICDPLRSCSIIEDNGLSSAFTIAHELGHVFNLPHDDESQCKAFQSGPARGGRQYHVMAPTLDANSRPWDWSLCSAHLMTDFIDAGLAECLRDTAKVNTWNDIVDSYNRPGWLYSADRQCQYIFGEGYGLCPYMSDPACNRLWCTNKTDSPGSGCRTQHMPWADGTQCGNQKECHEGQCVQVPAQDLKPVNGGWSAWSKFGPCSRSCGGGVRTKERACTNPVPKDGGRFCLGRRTQYKSCNTQLCPAGSEDFRVEQCAKFNGRVHINNLPPSAKWVPKYAGIHMKDACKLYCRVSHTTAYYQLAKTVTDGTKCSPFTDDVCVNGQCWRAGCDNKLGSKMKRDRCGVCGGDNYTCRTVTGSFNNAIYGYNFITTIPSGATQIDIRQHGHSYLSDDDNYLALQNGNKEYILNGEFMVRTEKWVINIKGAVLDYSGSEDMVERINSTRMIGEPVNIYVLSVGKLHPPNVTYSYTVSTGDNVRFVWSNMGSWKKCSHICRGKRTRRIVCVREDDNLIVSKRRCKRKGLKKPSRIEEPCNTECKLEWRVLSVAECPVRCGEGRARQLVHCVKQTGFSQVEILRDNECVRLGAKPDETVTCNGKCLRTFWSYTDWSPCSVSCGGGTKERQARCVDEDGQELPDSECKVKDKVTSAPCSPEFCAEWQAGEWLACSATCGGGRKLRKVYCVQGEQKVDESACDEKQRPAARKECHLKDCPEWYPGGWGPCSVTCDKGVSMRAVKCRLGSSLLEDTMCDASKRPEDTQPCFMGSCPTTPPLTSTTTTKTAPQAAFWRFGSWTECSATCGTGSKHRFVSCMDYQGLAINVSFCNHLPRPASVESCVTKPCGDWHPEAWSDCTVTCGEGIQTRYVRCMFNAQVTDEAFCDIVEKPVTEHRCNRGTCISPDEGDFRVGVITSNRVEGSSRWLTWQWSACSVTCGGGWQHRHVVCHDEKGQAETCDKSLKPDEYQSCQSRPCPSWHAEEWPQCSAKACNEESLQTRQVVCRLGSSSSSSLPDSDCDAQQRPADKRTCKGPCVSTRWRTGLWSSCSVTCGRGLMQRDVTCQDKDGNSLPYTLCGKAKPRNTKRCSAGPCPRWHKGKWSKCSASCGKGVKTREVACLNSQEEVVSPVMCPRDKQPKNVRHCQLEDCSQFVWSVGTWSECSKTCGFGQKHRPVTCKNRHGTEVSSHLCDAKTKPKMKRRCSEFPCPFIWNTSPWSPCSTSCGEGQQMRTVVCQAVTKEGWLLPGEVRDGCLPSEKPTAARYCNYGDCRARHHWTVGPWGECSAKCGFGQEHRQVVCTDREKQQASSSLCLRLYRPPRHRSCYNGPCYARSCKELKELTTIRKDGDYQIQVGTQLVSIYCKDMTKSTPVEYLSLPAGEEANFAEVYGERLRRPATCPYNRVRPATCDLCRIKQYKQAGNTTYSKIRIDLHTLRVLVNDGEFSHVHTGKFTPFGTAGDCYSSSSCPQGQFSISLVGTAFIVSVNTTWILQGNEATQQIWRLRDGQIIRGLCGGYCGVCSPDHLTGLQLELLK